MTSKKGMVSSQSSPRPNKPAMVNDNFVINSQLSPRQIELHPLVQQLLIVLSEKEKYIIQNRFNLGQAGRKSLEEIGQHFGVTRERIRQIERDALKKLERNAKNTNLRVLTEFAKTLLTEEGGIMQDQSFKQKLMDILPNVGQAELQDLHLALVLDPAIHFHSNTLLYEAYWRLNPFEESLVDKVSKKALQILKKEGHVLTMKRLTEQLKRVFDLNLSEACFTNLLKVCKECKLTENGIGLLSWRDINPRTLKDKLHFILRREKKPLHFRKLTELIRDAQFDSKRINVEAVHNELIRNPHFILIGRGIYALDEWGFEDGTVAEVMERLLADGKPRSREEIAKAVLKERHVKSTTIYLNLKNKSHFARVGRDKYTLSRLA